jgi:glycyl-tRNA synthetase beta chain
VADAVRDHYKPVGPSDTVPTAPVTVAVALADKLDTLVGFFAIDEKPTGSRDPFALRRAALGVIRLILANNVRMIISGWADTHWLVSRLLKDPALKISPIYLDPFLKKLEVPDFLKPFEDRIDWKSEDLNAETDSNHGLMVAVSGFVLERFKVMLREQDNRYDLIDAASFSGSDNDLVRITRRVEALSAFLASEDGENLLAGYKRATNILKAEEKKNLDEAAQYRLNPELSVAAAPEEAALVAALRTEQGRVDEALAAEDFTRAMQHLAHLRAPVDAFFDKVLVNDPDPAIRLNRLRLLTQVRDTANRVADFSLIAG